MKLFMGHMIDELRVKKIKEALVKNPKGLSISEIARKTDMTRITVTKYLSYLLGRGEVEMKQFGKVKVFYIKGGR